ncbi:hypothetical protein [Nitrospira sp. Nam74]
MMQFQVRLKLAEHPSIDEETLEQLALDDEPLIRLLVVSPPSCLHPFLNDSLQIPMALCGEQVVNVGPSQPLNLFRASGRVIWTSES